MKYIISKKELDNIFGWGIDGEDFEYDKFMENIKSKLANQKYLDRQEVEKIVGNNVFFDEDGDVTEAYPEDIVTAICNLALVDREKIVNILNLTVSEWRIFKGEVEEYPYNSDYVADEIISAIGGK